MSLAYYDGKFVEKASVVINPADFGFSRGLTVFELARVYGGVPFRLSDHLDRLAHGAGMFGIRLPDNFPEMSAVVQQLCASNKYPDSILKFYLTAGECAQASGTSFAACAAFTPHLVIMEDEVNPADPEAPYGLELYSDGQRLKIVPFERELPTVKSANYSLGYHAAIKAGKDWDDVLFTRRDGIVTEATRSNFFCVIDGVLCTAKSGMLFGITRKVLLELCNRHDIPVKECDLTRTEIMKATEAFTTGSFAEMLPATQIDDHRLTTTTQGPVYKRLRKLFTAYISESCSVRL